MKILPSDFYESLAGLDGYRINAVCMGVRRSATTMIYQIVRDAFPEGGVVKTHSFLDVPADVPVICTYRHFLECAVSWWRVTRYDHANRNAWELGKWGCEPEERKPVEYDRAICETPSVEAAVDAAVMVHRDVLHLEQYRIRRTNGLLLSYCPATRYLAEVLSGLLRRPITPADCERHSLASNRTLRRFTADPVEEFGPDDQPHCFEGRNGVWRDYCTDDTRDAMLSILGPDLERYGYET